MVWLVFPGWFTQSKEPRLQRDYCYAYSQQNGKFVEWQEREIYALVDHKLQ